jgi:hypothetical protein
MWMLREMFDLPNEVAAPGVIAPDWQFVTREKVDVEDGWSIGDDVSIVGLFNCAHGVSRNEPIVREGSLALALLCRRASFNGGRRE